MKKNIITTLKLAVVLAITGSACTQGFEELNTNPNNPDVAPIESVFAYSIVELGDRFNINSEMEYAASYVGHISMSQKNDAQNYLALPPSAIWTQYYVRNLTNLNGILTDATDDDVNLKAAAMVIKAYATQINVDAHGPMPYFDASQKDDGKNQPKFDSEQEIYADMLEQLRLANSLFSADAKKVGAGDVMYAGDIVAWKKFANSLRLRMAMRISNVDEATAKAEIAEILGDPVTYPIFESNADNAVLHYPGDDWKDPWTRSSAYKPYIRIAAPIVDTLKSLADPRLAQYAVLTSKGEYVGIQVGAMGTPESKVHDQFVMNPDNGKVFFLTYSEVEFIKAEAYARNLVAGDANAAYENAITANLEYYEIDAAEITTYLAQPAVAFNDNLYNIHLQKWISLFRQSWEAWAEMRRTDVPKLGLAARSVYDEEEHNCVPFRFGYPQAEKDLNGANIPANVTEVDHYWGYQIWWDTRPDVY